MKPLRSHGSTGYRLGTGIRSLIKTQTQTVASWHDTLSGWFETDYSPKRILSMEGLRGLAIALVFVCHFQIVILERLTVAFHSRFYLAVAELGGTGVDLFFLLSGMLIYRAAMKPDLHYGRFMLRRIQRIYPTFVVVLFLYLVMSSAFHIKLHVVTTGIQATVAYVIANLLLLPGVVDVLPIIAAAWSLSYEFCFYLFLPLLVRILRLRSWSTASRAALWLVVIVCYLTLVFVKPEWFPQYRYFDGSFVRFTLFVAGMLIEDLLPMERIVSLLGTVVQLALLVVASITALCLYVYELFTVETSSHHGLRHAALRAAMVLICYGVLSIVTLSTGGILKNLFSRDILRWTGNISYSFYLIHGLILNLVAVSVLRLMWVVRYPVLAAPLLFFIALTATFGAAAVLFLLVEKPYSLRRSTKAIVNTIKVNGEMIFNEK